MVNFTKLLAFFNLIVLFLSMCSSHSYQQNLNCALVVPEKPLTEKGLTTPYIIKALNTADGPCAMSNANQQSFVESVIYVPSTGQLFVYHPVSRNCELKTTFSHYTLWFIFSHYTLWFVTIWKNCPSTSSVTPLNGCCIIFVFLGDNIWNH